MCKLCFHFPPMSVAVFLHSLTLTLGYIMIVFLALRSRSLQSIQTLESSCHFHYRNEQRILREAQVNKCVFHKHYGQRKELRKISLYYLHSSRIFKKTSFRKNSFIFFFYQSEWLHHFFYTFLFPAFLLFLVYFCYLPGQMTVVFFLLILLLGTDFRKTKDNNYIN